jgi:hypothetical protein
MICFIKMIVMIHFQTNHTNQVNHSSDKIKSSKMKNFKKQFPHFHISTFPNYALGILLLALLFTACKKNKPGFFEEKPLPVFLATSGFDQLVNNVINLNTFEFGLFFTPKVNGKINAVTVKVHDAATNVRVTIWDAATKTVLKTITVPSVAADVETKQQLDTPFTLEKDKQYAISFNLKNVYERYRADSGEAPYPITAGNITITGFAYLLGASQTFPTNNITDIYYGDLGFVFQQTGK